MKRSKEFENILNDCLERMLVTGQTLEQCLELYPAHSAELRPLLETALQVNSASAFQPRPEFRERARRQILAALRDKSIRPHRSLFSRDWQPRWATALVSLVVALVLASGGTVAAASDSMPDEFLYPVKLAAEQVRLTLTPSRLAKAELYTELADRRVNEIARMTGENKPEEIERTAKLLETYLNKVVVLGSGRQLVVTMKVAPAPVESAVSEEVAVTREAPEAPSALSAVSEEAEIARESAATPELAAVPMTEAAEEEKVVVEQESGALPAADKPESFEEGGDERDEEEKDKKEDDEESREAEERLKLKAKIEQRALDNIARLKAMVATAPPAARPALLRAIALSEESYRQAIGALEGDD